MNEKQDMQVTVNDMLSGATQAERVGVPIDWKTLAFSVANAATQYITMLENQLAALENRTGLDGTAAAIGANAEGDSDDQAADTTIDQE